MTSRERQLAAVQHAVADRIPVDAQAAVNVPAIAEQLKREYGKDVTFFGGINTQKLPFISSQEVAEEVRQTIEVLGGMAGTSAAPTTTSSPTFPPRTPALCFGRRGNFLKDSSSRMQYLEEAGDERDSQCFDHRSVFL